MQQDSLSSKQLHTICIDTGKLIEPWQNRNAFTHAVSISFATSRLISSKQAPKSFNIDANV